MERNRLLLHSETTTSEEQLQRSNGSYLICMTVRHLFRSRELTTMPKRLGHSETYRFTLELETAIAKVLHGSSNLLSTQIVVSPVAIANEMQ